MIAVPAVAGIPIPRRKSKIMVEPELIVSAPVKFYPWRSMGVGHAFFAVASRRSIDTLASNQNALTGRVFAVREVQGGVGVWRRA